MFEHIYFQSQGLLFECNQLNVAKYYSFFNNINDVMMHYQRLYFNSSVAWFEIPF
jgi:hypothetical protein